MWVAFHGPEGHVVSDLITVSLPGLAKRILGHSPKSQRQYVFPSLRGSLLAYGVEVPGTGAEHVVLVDLSKPGAIPRQLDSSGNATTPTLTADSVIWKEAPNIVDAGQLVRYSLRDRSTTQLNLGTWSSATLPSAGRRFATAWGTDSTQFYLVDLTNNRPILLEGFSPTGPLNDVRPYISGDLLVWIRGVSSLTASGYPTQPLELEWARLVP